MWGYRDIMIIAQILVTHKDKLVQK